MKEHLKRLFAVLISLCLISGCCACGKESSQTENGPTGNAEKVYTDAHIIELSENSAKLDGTEVESFDYTWHADPTQVHDEVKNSPAEYFTGTKPETDAAVYIDHELYYYPSLDVSGFKLVNYDGEQEWAYYYADGENDEYIFATLPRFGSAIPTDMMHTAQEAAENSVLHITKSGSYILEGDFKGQIWVDLGDEDETFTDEDAVVTLILNGVDIYCSAAPGLVFYSVYEADNTWESREDSLGPDVDISNTGANVIIADGSENTVSGSNVYRMLKTKYKDEDSKDAVKVQKKARKIDAAFYSFVSMNISGGAEGTGSLTVNSDFEGLDSELHLILSGGNITINSQDDGINVNEDNVSAVFFDGANVTINAAQGAEGDGVDSNGYIVINGGTVSVNGVVAPDSSFDSEDGVYYNGGTIVIDGEEQQLTKGSITDSIGSANQGFGPGIGGPGGQGNQNQGFGPGMGSPDGQGDQNQGFGPGQEGQFGPGNNSGMSGGQPDISGPGGLNSGDFDINEFKKKVAELGDDATLEDVLILLGLGQAVMPGGPNQNGFDPK